MSRFFPKQLVPLSWLLLPSILWSILLRSPTLCIDVLLLPLIEWWVPLALARVVRWAWVFVFCANLLADWNISPGTYLFYLQQALPFSPASVLVSLGVASIVMVWFGFRKDPLAGREQWRKPLFLAGCTLLVVKMLAAGEIVHAPVLRDYLRSSTLFFVRMQVLSHQFQDRTEVSATPDETFYSLVKQDGFHPSRAVLLVVESWGEQKDALPMIAGGVASQGFQVLKSGFTSYRGSTLSGELRELCSKYVLPSDGLFAQMADFHCAPRLLREKGYEVVGLHGYNQSFYARGAVWTGLGIKTRLFIDDLPAQPTCPGAFPGVCDENLIESGVRMLDAASKPTFLYMLTLSSHEPLAPAVLERRGAYFNDVPVVHPTQIVARRAISSLVADLKQRRNHVCTLVYVVGDHQPPSASAKGGIFEPGKVPYVIFSQDCPQPDAG
jgi:hypothetical protein